LIIPRSVRGSPWDHLHLPANKGVERNRANVRKRDEDRGWDSCLATINGILRGRVFLKDGRRPNPDTTMRLRQLSEGVEDVHRVAADDLPVLGILVELLDGLEALVVAADVVEAGISRILTTTGCPRHVAKDYARKVRLPLSKSDGSRHSLHLPASEPGSLKSAFESDENFTRAAKEVTETLWRFSLLRTAYLDHYKGVSVARKAIERAFEAHGKRLRPVRFRREMVERSHRVTTASSITSNGKYLLRCPRSGCHLVGWDGCCAEERFPRPLPYGHITSP
jgi:hypothetical protein